MDISLLLPAKNAGDVLASSLKSCLRGKGSPREILLLLTEGDQPTLDIVDQFKSSRIRKIMFHPSVDLYQKLQVGMIESRFSHIARMDADDICFPWRWCRQAMIMSSKKVDAVFSTAIVFGKSLRPLPLIPQIPITISGSEISSSLVTGNPLVHPTLLARKATLLEVGGYQKSPAEDLNLWLRLALNGNPIIRDGVPAILYRYHKNSISHQSFYPATVSEDASINDLRRQLAQLLLPELQNLDKTEPMLAVFKNRYRSSLKQKLASLSLGLNQ